MHIEPYLMFEGRCDEALDFYKSAVGAEVTMLMRFKDAPDQSMVSSGSADKVMHASVRIGESMLNASDGRCSGSASFAGVTLTLTAADAAEADRLYAALADGGQAMMPMSKTFFSPAFGMLTDRFGVSWMVMAR